MLFAVFLNDLEEYLDSRANSGVVLDNFDDNLFQFIKILVLLYADDMILMSDNPTSLQKSLNDFVNYCQEWKLEMIIDKTKAMTFGARTNRNSVLKIGSTPIEHVSSYKYLGCNFAKSGSFLTIRRHLVNQANKALHLLYKRLYNLHLPFHLAIKLFDNTIVPIPTYSSEVWGYKDLALIERVYCTFFKVV